MKGMKTIILLVSGLCATACGKFQGSKRSFSYSENYISPQYREQTSQNGQHTEYGKNDIVNDFYEYNGGYNPSGSTGGATENPSGYTPPSEGYLYTNVPGVNSDPGVNINPEDPPPPVVPFDPAMRERYFWKCTYTLTGEKGAVWHVERLNKINDGCAASHTTVRKNNPKASIRFDGQIFMGYHDDNTHVPFHWRCDYTLVGEKNARWKVQRHLKHDDNCQTARRTVIANNPKASIASETEVFLGYHMDNTDNLFHWKCVYKLEGEKGAKWDVERFLKFDDDCKTATKTVKANNPKAKILSVREVFIGYHKEQ